MIDQVLGDVPNGWTWIYAPVLRAKASEWHALAALSPGVRRRIAPIIEFIPDWQAPGANTTGRKRRAPQTPNEYVHRVLESAVKSTPAGTSSFVYFGLAGSKALWNGIELWRHYQSQVPPSADVIPLTDLASIDASGVGHVTRSRGLVGLRVTAAELDAPLPVRINRALDALGVSAQAAHIVVDLKDAPRATSHSQIRTHLGSAERFATIVVVAGVFPQDLTSYQPGVTPEPRAEWDTWWHEHAITPTSARLLSFGDYTTQCAHYQPSPEARGSVSLRYTTDNSVLVFRGRQSNNGTGLGYEQMHGHCRLLVRRSDYDGAAFSRGDQQINCWTDPSNGTGNSTQWRTASIVHHITHVVVQLQDPVGASKSVREWARAQVSPICR